jgi:hypothetical protein
MRAFDWSCVAIVSSAIAFGAAACGGRLQAADCGPQMNYCADTDVCCPDGYVCGTGNNGCPAGGCCEPVKSVMSPIGSAPSTDLPPPGQDPWVPSAAGPSPSGQGGGGKTTTRM